MANRRTHSIEFKRQVAQEFLAGETLHGLAKRHDASRTSLGDSARPPTPLGHAPEGLAVKKTGEISNVT
jgi:hypothetical protein